MNGLECSEIMLSNLERTTRIDAEFYAKDNLRVLDILSKYSLEFCIFKNALIHLMNKDLMLLSKELPLC